MLLALKAPLLLVETVEEGFISEGLFYKWTWLKSEFPQWKISVISSSNLMKRNVQLRKKKKKKEYYDCLFSQMMGWFIWSLWFFILLGFSYTKIEMWTTQFLCLDRECLKKSYLGIFSLSMLKPVALIQGYTST